MLKAGLHSICVAVMISTAFFDQLNCKFPRLPHMNELKRTLRDMDANIRRVNQELRNAKRRASELRKFRLREPQRTTARILVAMHHGEPTAAMDYVQSKRKGKELDHTMAAQAEAELREGSGGESPMMPRSNPIEPGRGRA